MGLSVCGGAMCACSFGMAPAILNVLPVNMAVSVQPLATIFDYVPLVNIMPFGMCNSVSNPQVAAATAAALGVLTPMPCIPCTTAPWMPGSPTVLISNKPALNNNSKLMCMWGGVIQITNPGTTTIQIP